MLRQLTLLPSCMLYSFIWLHPLSLSGEEMAIPSASEKGPELAEKVHGVADQKARLVTRNGDLGVVYNGGEAIVRFAEGSGQLVLKGNGSFELAGEDRKFLPATATLKGDAVEVVAPSVANPVAVRYAFLNAPEMSLFNAEGWPALPFRSDAWDIPKGF